MQPATSRTFLLLAVGLGLAAAGCIPTDATQRDRRYPDERRLPPRVERGDRSVPGRAVIARVERDADRYVHSIDRALRLDRRQERQIAHLLADRAFDQLRRGRARDRAYPFPRRFEDRTTETWWKKSDREIERVLDRRQRRVYRDLVREQESHRRDRRRRGRGRN